MKKTFYIVLGCIGVALGAALPLLPAFPFLMLAAYFFAKSSQRLNDWFVNTRLYKSNLESFICNEAPDDDSINACKALGAALV